MNHQNQKTIVVTGASSGLGLYCAHQLAASGARVIAACRDLEKGKKALGALGPSVEVRELDLADLGSVQRFVAQLGGTLSQLDVLLNNAGIMMVPWGKTRQGFESQMGVNHLGHFALTAALFPLLKKAPASRVVTVSSIAHRRGQLRLPWSHDEAHYDRGRAYSDSKLANLIFALEFARRLKAAGSQVSSLAVHPGWTGTPLFRELPRLQWISDRLAMPVDAGAASLLAACTDSTLRNGDFRGPSGFRELRGSLGPARPSRVAQDPELGEKLWHFSEQAIGQAFRVD